MPVQESSTSQGYRCSTHTHSHQLRARLTDAARSAAQSLWWHSHLPCPLQPRIACQKLPTAKLPLPFHGERSNLDECPNLLLICSHSLKSILILSRHAFCTACFHALFRGHLAGRPTPTLLFFSASSSPCMAASSIRFFALPKSSGEFTPPCLA
jgi:hypothetical protein